MQARAVAPREEKAPRGSDKRLRGLALQGLVIAAVIGGGVLILRLVLDNMARRGVKTGFDFLFIPAGFGMAESAIPYSAADSYGWALIAGLVNTMIVAALGIVLATVIGIIVGVARRSSNFIVSRLAATYVETLRNVPLLVQLIIWWDVLKISAPGPRQAWQPLPHVFVSNRGIIIPMPIFGATHLAMLAGAIAGLVATLIRARRARRRGRDFASLRIGAPLILGPPLLIALMMGGASFDISLPVLKGFNFSGGRTISPEFAALLVGLSLYTASYIAEIVRGGIAAVGRGQTEAAAALGLRHGQVLRLVTLPQALRAIVPPLIGQYLSLTKNSSLGVAIAFPDLVSVGNTVLNQTGQAVEVGIEMAAYLTLSLAISAAMNAYNSRIARTGTALGAQRETGAQKAPKDPSTRRSRAAEAAAWLKANLFNSRGNTLATLLGLVILAFLLPPLIRWLANANFAASDGRACRETGGACLAFIRVWFRFLLFGRYPQAAQWRPALVVVIFLAMIALSTRSRFWGRSLFVIWGAGLGLVLLLMHGGIAGLTLVETELWNGLPLTLILAVGSMMAAFPLAVLLALGRRSRKPIIRAPCVAYIELIRGVPLITILFMAAVMVPILLPSGFSIDKALRAAMAFALFGAAYLAEAVRGGLQAVPHGQYEASEALGLSYWRKTRLVILPQALATAIPALVNTFIGTFKDTSLVVIIGLFDLLSTAKIAIEDLSWQGFYLEAYLFIAAIFFGFCFFMSRFSQRLERRLKSAGES